jgi:ligand-binding sensor domain-containing protein/signal transduction histidine kinase
MCVSPLALWLGLLLAGAARGQPRETPGTTVVSTAASPLRVKPGTIRVPVVDGDDIPFNRLSTIQGLSQTKVSWIVQDEQGFLWLGTQHGLNRYDGYNFKVFVPDAEDPETLSGVYITVLFKDREGRLWIGCDQFLHRFEPATEKFARYPVPFATHISEDAAGMLWLSTDAGLYSLDPAQGTIHRYTHEPENPDSLSSSSVKASGEDRTGRFWVSTNKGLDEFDRTRGVFTLRVPVRERSQGWTFHEDSHGTFWLADLHGPALAVFDRATNTLTPYSIDEPKAPGPMLVRFTAMVEDRSGTLWLATQGSGVLKFDGRRRQLVRYRHDPDDPASIAQDNVENLFVDREGSLWAGLGSMGLTRSSTVPLPFARVPPDPANPAANVDRFVGALHADGQGNLWLGNAHALNRIDRRTGAYVAYRPSPERLATAEVITIREDPSGDLWIGTYNRGLLRFDVRTGRFQTYRHDPRDPFSLGNDIIPRLLIDRGGVLWAASADGLNRFDAATGRFTLYKCEPGKRSQSYLDIAQDREGALWLGTDASGLHRFDPATGRFTVYRHVPAQPGTLSDNRVNSVHFDRAGTLWLGTQNGLDRFDPRTGTFASYGRRHGLPGDVVGCILEHDDGALWMSTNNGVARFDPRSRSFTSYSTADGLPGPDLTGWGACARSAAGEMFFGGFSGATAFFPDRVMESADAPPVVLTDFRLFGQPVTVRKGSPLARAINYTEAVTLSHDQNFFSIGFSALSYLNVATNRYRYRLEGFEPGWNEVASDERRASYTKLPAGTYTLHVQAARARGPWTEPGARLVVDVLPPWWSTAWFRAFYIGSLLFAGLAFYSYRVRQLEKTMSARFDDRLAERTRLARELHDTLLQTMQASKLIVEDALDRPRDADAMRQTLERLLKWLEQGTQEGRGALNSLRTSTTETNDLAAALQRVMENRGPAGSIAATLSIVGEARDMHPIVRDEVCRIGYEAIRNAYQHSRARRLTVELTYAQDLTLQVTDDGAGIEAGIVEAGKDGHFGLQGMRERAARIGGTLTLESAPGAGTEIRLAVPGRIIYRGASHRRPAALARLKALLGGKAPGSTFD